MKLNRMFSNDRGGSLIEIGLLIGLVAILAVGLISILGKDVNGGFVNLSSTLINGIKDDGAGNEEAEVGPQSCQEWYLSGETATGFYPITVNGSQLTAYCTMVSGGEFDGGWTLISLQKEGADAGWNDGIDPKRNENSYLNSSFSLSLDQVPQHGSAAVGYISASNAPHMVDGLEFNDPDQTILKMLELFETHPANYWSFGGRNLRTNDVAAIHFFPKHRTDRCDRTTYVPLDNADAALLGFVPNKSSASFSWAYNSKASTAQSFHFTCFNGSHQEAAGDSGEKFAIWVR